MADTDPTQPVPRPKPPVPDSELISDTAVARVLEASTPTHSSASTSWQPPSIEQLQAALPQYKVTAFIAQGGMDAVYKGIRKRSSAPSPSRSCRLCSTMGICNL